MGAILAIGNLADSATITTTTGTMLRPLSQLQVPWARGLARGPINYSFGQTTLLIRADLGTSLGFSCIGLVGLNDVVCNFSAKFSDTAFDSTDKGTGSAVNDGMSGDIHGNALWYIGDHRARYIQLQVTAIGLADGFRHVDARRLLIMQNETSATDTIAFSDGVDFDWSLTHIDLSSAEETPRGGVFTSPQGTYRRLEFGITGMTSTEAEDLRGWLAAARRTTECVVSIRDEGAVALQSNRTIYGRLVDWSPIQHTGGDTYACDSIVVHETPYPAL